VLISTLSTLTGVVSTSLMYPVKWSFTDARITELFTECMIYTELVPGANKKASDEILIELMNIENEFIKRINHTEPGNAKVYYRKLYKDFDESIVKVLDKMTKLKK
jgi:hypothetical protein